MRIRVSATSKQLADRVFDLGEPVREIKGIGVGTKIFNFAPYTLKGKAYNPVLTQFDKTDADLRLETLDTGKAVYILEVEVLTNQS